MADRVESSVYEDIKIVCELMLKVHYFEEANWLWMAVSAPQACNSQTAQDALRSSRSISRQFGYPSVAKWLERNILVDD